MAGRQNLLFDPTLVQESVLLAAAAAPLPSRQLFEEEKDAVYEIENDDEREIAFHDLDARWFERFGIAEPLRSLLAEHSFFEEGIDRAIVIRARSRREEGADLHENRDPSSKDKRPVLVIRLRPSTLLDRRALGTLLRHELLFAVDMLDPVFGYEPSIPHTEGGPMETSLLLERYRTLWRTSVDGRLAARGELPPEVEARRKLEFREVFPMLSPAGEKYFERFFHGPRPSHTELLAFASSPGNGESEGAVSKKRCPICRLPTTVFHPAPGELGADVLDFIRTEFPQWEPRQGLCQHCGDLFQARERAESSLERNDLHANRL